MKPSDFISETPAIELADRLPTLKKYDYDTIDKLMQDVAKKHSITGQALHDIFVKKYKRTPDDWVKNRDLDETELEQNLDIQKEVDQFAKWACNVLHVQSNPEFDLSTDTEDAQDNHHTGRHVQGSNKIWVYIKNRNLVDILRTVFHELVHVRQGELGMIKPDSSYPGSPIEVMADMLAGKYIKIYGEKHHYIFQ